MLFKKFLYITIMGSLFTGLYVSILGSHGLVERRNLEKKLNSLREEVDKLEVEHYTLTQKERFFSKEDSALSSEKARHFLLDGETHLIKFKEVIEIEDENQILAAHVPISHLNHKESKKESNSLQIIKIFYLMGAGFIGVAVFLKMKRD